MIFRETLANELTRLIGSLRMTDDESVRNEAWNLIADFTVVNSDTIISALALPKSVVIKPLDWVGEDSEIAQTPFGQYSVSENVDGEWEWTFHSSPHANPYELSYVSEIEVKKAVQDDYEHHIRSAILSVLIYPKGIPQSSMAATSEAVEWLAQWLHDEVEWPNPDFPCDNWPEHPDDTGQSVDGHLNIIPADTQEQFRTIARRLLTAFPRSRENAEDGMRLDLVERLRLWDGKGHIGDDRLLSDAAAEIEHLRTELAETKAGVEEKKEDALLRAKHIHTPEDELVMSLCERIGYGAVMDSAARLWTNKDPMGSFYIGGRIGRRTAAESMEKGK